MAFKEKEITKLYYPIGEVAVKTSMIRFYEKEFDVLQPKKNGKGNRLFRPEDIDNLKVIFHLIKDKGYTIQGAKEYLKSGKNDVHEQQKIIDALEKLKSLKPQLVSFLKTQIYR